MTIDIVSQLQIVENLERIIINEPHTFDRDLMRKSKPQIYGSQYSHAGIEVPWELYEIDSTVISDEECIEYGVETLFEQREKVKAMNKKKLS